MANTILKPVNFKKSIIILSLIIIFNICFSLALFAGAKLLVNKASKRKDDIVSLSKETAFYTYQKLSGEFLNKSDDDVRKDDQSIVEKQNLFDAQNYDITLSFDIPGKSITGEVIMKASSLSDTLSRIYINLYDNMKVSSVTYSKGSGSSYDIRKTDAMKDAEYKQDKG